jgi:hypothetical protein
MSSEELSRESAVPEETVLDIDSSNSCLEAWRGMPLIAQGQRRLANTESTTDKVKHGADHVAIVATG